MQIVLDKLGPGTQKSYKSQYQWWELFCSRRGINPLRVVTAPSVAEENLVLDFVIHSGIVMGKSPGTVKLRIASIRSRHLSLGLPDPFHYMARLPQALAGLKRRAGTKERRFPVTPRMLSYIAERLDPHMSSVDALLWAALMLGFFFLLRASEYIDPGYRTVGRGLRGSDLSFRKEGRALRNAATLEADEVMIVIRGSKTDVYNRGEARNHFARNESDQGQRRADGLGGFCPPDLCVVSALKILWRHFPQRFDGGAEADEFLLRDHSDRLLSRETLQAALQLAAKQLGIKAEIGSHSLRFGGASALWAAYHDSALVRRWGRWASDSFQTYIWEAREGARGVAESMANADLTQM
jgi:integrase